MNNNTANQQDKKITVLGIDLAKQSFHIHGVDAEGRKVISKKLTRKRLQVFIAQLPPCLIGLEACGGPFH